MPDFEKRLAAAQQAAMSMPDRSVNDTLPELYNEAWAARKGLKRGLAMRDYVKLVKYLQPL